MELLVYQRNQFIEGGRIAGLSPAEKCWDIGAHSVSVASHSLDRVFRLMRISRRF